MVESVHCPIALKSSLCGGILESMYAMDCTPFAKAVLLPFFGSSFLQVTSIVLSYCISNCISGLFLLKRKTNWPSPISMLVQ